MTYSEEEVLACTGRNECKGQDWIMFRQNQLNEKLLTIRSSLLTFIFIRIIGLLLYSFGNLMRHPSLLLFPEYKTLNIDFGCVTHLTLFMHYTWIIHLIAYQWQVCLYFSKQSDWQMIKWENQLLRVKMKETECHKLRSLWANNHPEHPRLCHQDKDHLHFLLKM